MEKLDEYLQAAKRENTERSYAAAVRHFEIEWQGFLPATADSIARYLSHYAEQLSINTLRQRLAGLARWHSDQGFPDPTKAPLVRKVMKGIMTKHRTVERQALPLQLQQLEQVIAWLNRSIAEAESKNDQLACLRCSRDKALLLLGFWRGFRGDELIRLQVEHVEVVAGQYLQCFFPTSKNDRHSQGRYFKVPALPRLCPVAGYLAWIQLSALTEGPVFRAINKYGRVSNDALHANSLVPLLRRLFAQAGLLFPENYSSHSLRRGFATWASDNGWDVKTLMNYVGWRDMKSALRYIESADLFAQTSITQALEASPNTVQKTMANSVENDKALLLDVRLNLQRAHSRVKGLSKAHQSIESLCLAPHSAQRLDKTGQRYRIELQLPRDADLDDTIAAMLDRMQSIANNHQCLLEVTISDPLSGRHWD